MSENSRKVILEDLPDPSTPITESQRYIFFGNLAVEHLDELRTQRQHGLWDGKRGTKDDWRNVSEHCLVEVARATQFAGLLDLSDELTADLKTAAVLHDFYKRRETELVEAQGPSWEVFEQANGEAEAALRAAGYSDRVVRLSGAVGHGSLLATEAVLAKPELTDADKASLVMHYIDDYTDGSKWAKPTRETVDGVMQNSLDFRAAKNTANARYRQLNEDGLTHLGGRTFDVQRDIGHRVESRLAGLITEQTGQVIEPLNLPIMIDGMIQQQIAQIAA